MGKEEKMRRISCFLLMLTLLLTTVVVAWGGQCRLMGR